MLGYFLFFIIRCSINFNNQYFSVDSEFATRYPYQLRTILTLRRCCSSESIQDLKLLRIGSFVKLT
jgi:hypothetical protein